MSNILNDVMPKVLASALETFRESCAVTRLVNTSYSNEAAKKGSVVDIPVPSKMPTNDVVPSNVAPNPADIDLQTVQLPLNYWRESAFTLTDKEVKEVLDGIAPMQITESARALANFVNSTVLLNYKKIYNFVGTPGTTPFATDLTAAAQARKVLNKTVTPTNERCLILNGDAEANAVVLPALSYYMNSGETSTLREGQIGRKLGFDWYYDQQMDEAFHVSGTLSGGTVAAAPVSNPRVHGVTSGTVTVTATTAQTVKIGDVFTVAGDTQTYVVNQDATSNGSITINFSPAPAVSWANGSAVTLRVSHQNNLCFQKNAIALAVRPFSGDQFSAELSGGQAMTMVDPASGLPLRLEVTREHRRVRWALDILFGTEIIRPETAVRILG